MLKSRQEMNFSVELSYMEKQIINEIDSPSVKIERSARQLVEGSHEENTERIINRIIQDQLTYDNLMLIESYDKETAEHCFRVAKGCIEIGHHFNLTVDQLEILATAGLLHDLGKCHVPHDIIAKPGSLSPAERKQMEEHATEGYKMLDENRFKIERKIVGAHHWWQRGGYGIPPDESASFYSQILSVIDKYDALMNKRQYKEPFTRDKTEQIIMDDSTADTNLKKSILKKFRELEQSN